MIAAADERGPGNGVHRDASLQALRSASGGQGLRPCTPFIYAVIPGLTRDDKNDWGLGPKAPVAEGSYSKQFPHPGQPLEQTPKGETRHDHHRRHAHRRARPRSGRARHPRRRRDGRQPRRHNCGGRDRRKGPRRAGDAARCAVPDRLDDQGGHLGGGDAARRAGPAQPRCADRRSAARCRRRPGADRLCRRRHTAVAGAEAAGDAEAPAHPHLGLRL